MPGRSCPQGELLRDGYQQESNSKNNVCQRINIGEGGNYGIRYPGFVVQAHLVSPFIDDLIYKKYNKPDTEQEIRSSRQLAVVMRDHEIDLVDAEQYHEEGLE